MLSWPLYFWCSLSRAFDLLAISTHVNEGVFEAGFFGGEGPQVALQQSAGQRLRPEAQPEGSGARTSP